MRGGEKVKVFMQKIILVGYGNVGKEIEKVLRANGVAIDLIVKVIMPKNI